MGEKTAVDDVTETFVADPRSTETTRSYFTNDSPF